MENVFDKFYRFIVKCFTVQRLQMILYKIVADEILAVVEKKLCSEFNSFLGIDANPVISVYQQDFNLD